MDFIDGKPLATSIPAYDPAILQEFAERMYAQARNLTAVCTALGLLGGSALGFACWVFLRKDISWWALIGKTAAIGALVGFAIGKEMAFWLKLQAQRTLCQLQVEINTRTTHAVPQSHR